MVSHGKSVATRTKETQSGRDGLGECSSYASFVVGGACLSAFGAGNAIQCLQENTAAAAGLVCLSVCNYDKMVKVVSGNGSSPNAAARATDRWIDSGAQGTLNGDPADTVCWLWRLQARLSFSATVTQ